MNSAARATPGVGAFAAVLASAIGVGAQPRARQPVPPPRNLALVGITSVGNRAQAWLVELQTRQKRTLTIGESAFGYRLKRVASEAVVLTRGGQEFPLRLGQKEIPAVRPSTPTALLPPVETPATVTVAPLPVEPAPVREEAPPREDTTGKRPVAPVVEPRTPAEELATRLGRPLTPEEATVLGMYTGYPGFVSPNTPGPYAPYWDEAAPYGPAPYNYPGWAYPTSLWSEPPSGLGVYSSRPAPTAGRTSRMAPGPRWNGQTSRRRGGSPGGSGTPSNPQTLRRRQSLFR